MTVFIAVSVLVLALVLQPALALFASLPENFERVGRRFTQLRNEFERIAMANQQLSELMGHLAHAKSF